MKKTINRPYRQQTEKPHLCGSVVDLPETKPVTAFEVFCQLRASGDLPEIKQDECALTELSLALPHLSQARFERPVVRPMAVSRDTEGNFEFEFDDRVSEEEREAQMANYIMETLDFGRLFEAVRVDRVMNFKPNNMAKVHSHVGNPYLHLSLPVFNLSAGDISEVYPDDAPKVRDLNEVARLPRPKRPVVRAASSGDEDREVASARLMKAARLVAKEHREELKALVHQ